MYSRRKRIHKVSLNNERTFTEEIMEPSDYLFSECGKTIILSDQEDSLEGDSFYMFSEVFDDNQPHFHFQEVIPISQSCISVDDNVQYQFSIV